MLALRVGRVQSIALGRVALVRPSLVIYLSPHKFSTSIARQSETPLSKTTDASHEVGSEGKHFKDEIVTIPTQPVASVQSNDVRGDWVLRHPVYSPEELKAVKVLHREAKTLSDKAAHLFVRLVRGTFDLVTGYKAKPIPPSSSMTLEELRNKGYTMSANQWLTRILFLETIAGVPGSVASTLRHLRSLRVMQRDGGWIHTLLEEAENERMHLMTFMTLRKPTLFFKTMVIGAQGIFYNLFFISYLMSPRTCHRFVGLLEEEAVYTYTRVIEEMEAGRILEWDNMPAPSIAKEYWRLSDNATLLDVMYAVRSDESSHRFVNHSLADLKQSHDLNPFAIREPSMEVMGSKISFDRDESANFVKESHDIITRAKDGEAPASPSP